MLLSGVLLISLVVSAIAWVVLKKRRLNRLTANIPTLSGELPIFGHTFKLCHQSKDIQVFLSDTSKVANQHDGIVKFWLGSKLFFGVTSPKIMKTLANLCLEKSMFYDFLEPCLGQGLIVSKEDIWRRHRRTMNPMFQVNVLKEFLPIFNRNAATLVAQLKQSVGVEKFNHWTVISSNTIETGYETIMGISHTEQLINSETYALALDNLSENYNKRIKNLLMHPNFIYKRTSLEKEDIKNFRTIKSVTAHAIRSKISTNKLQKGTIDVNVDNSFKSICDLMLEAREEGLFSEKEVMCELDNLMLAGYDTTATTVTYALLALGAYPDVQEKLFLELIEVLGDSPHDVTEADLPRLVYLEAVIMETLRLFSVVPAVSRKLDKTVAIDNYVFPKGGEVLLLNIGMNMREAWGDDVTIFKPERFFSKPAAKLFYPFAVGRRDCIGKAYAMMAMKVTLSHVLKGYRMRGSMDQLTVRYDIVLRPSSGFHITLEERPRAPAVPHV